LVFRTAPDGRRLYYSFGPWSRPYIVPDPGTEQRLGDRHRWMVGLLLAVMVAGHVLLQKIDPAILNTPSGCLGYLAVVGVAYLLLQRALVRPRLRRLARADSRLSLHDYYASMASEQSTAYLVLVFFSAIGMISVGAMLLLSQSEPLFGWLWLGVFVPWGAGW